MEQKRSFNKHAKEYDETRPSYSDEVIDFIIESTCGIEGPILEIAPGTGQATLPFLERGYAMDCVELGESLAEILKEKTRDYPVNVHVSAFEKWKSNKKYPVILCATAFHWLDKEIRFKKCAEHLIDDGKLVLVWHVFDSSNPIVKKAYEILFSYYPNRTFVDDVKEQRKAMINDSGYFILSDYLDHQWHIKETKEDFIKAFYVQSSFMSLESEKKIEAQIRIDAVFSNLDALVVSDVSTTVYIGERHV